MQQTRLFDLLSSFTSKIALFFDNPWRRFSLITISFFFGFFAAIGIITTAGQIAQWDITVSVVLMLFTELISIFVYSPKFKKSIWNGVLNAFKIGLGYSLYLGAVQLNT
jgi:hypothetical protein